MGSGKTSKMLTQFDLYRRRKKKPLIIKPCVDTRETGDIFTGWGVTKSRITKNEEPVYHFDSLKDTLKNLDFGVLFVDEAQFLTAEDVSVLTDVVDNDGKDVICYGLKTDANGNLFEGSACLVAMCDELVEIESLCEIEGCDNKACGHVRFVNGTVDISGTSVAIEKGDVTYKSVCRKHGKELIKKRIWTNS